MRSLTNGWTGGQYSVYRALLGLYLCVHFAALVPYGAELFSSAGVLPAAELSPFAHLFPNVLALWDVPLFVGALLVLGALASVLLAFGAWDRWAAFFLWYLLACLFGRDPLISNPSLPYVGWLLVAHALLAGKPYGAWAARGRIDPGGGWSLPGGVFLAGWIALAVGYTYSGWTKLQSPSWLDGSALARVLENPLTRPGPLRDLLRALPEGVLRLGTWSALALELAFAPLALFRRTRPWVWSTLALIHVGLIATLDFADLSLGMLCVHAFTFDPAWIQPRVASASEHVFYDGHCGLCHGFVRFLLAEDRARSSLRFAPLQGPTLATRLSPEERARLPDSIAVRTDDGRTLTHSNAVLHVLGRLGGLWRALALVLACVPRPARDLVYDGVARVRYRLFGQPAESCPLMPRELAARFDP